jgi:hypothetical protein
MGVFTGVQHTKVPQHINDVLWRVRRAIVLDIDAKEPAGRSKIAQLEPLSQLCLDVLDALLRLADDMAVIHIGRHNHLSSSAVLPDVHTAHCAPS